jgi:uncharacterized protein (DUF433 family)
VRSPIPLFGELSPLEMRDDLGGTPVPCVRNSPFEVADVILVLRDCDNTVAAAARELNLTADDVYACVECQREFPDLVAARVAACDFSSAVVSDAGVLTPYAVDDRARWDWRLAPV